MERENDHLQKHDIHRAIEHISCLNDSSTSSPNLQITLTNLNLLFFFIFHDGHIKASPHIV